MTFCFTALDTEAPRTSKLTTDLHLFVGRACSKTSPYGVNSILCS